MKLETTRLGSPKFGNLKMGKGILPFFIICTWRLCVNEILKKTARKRFRNFRHPGPELATDRVPKYHTLENSFGISPLDFE